MQSSAVSSKVAIVIIAGLVLALLLLWLHFTMAERRYQPTIDKLNQIVGAERSSRNTLVASVDKQNAAIAALRAQSEADKARIAELEEKATGEALDAYDKASLVLQERPVGTDLCTVASESFDAELRRERDTNTTKGR